jgi:uncharacterized membrane protein YeaQ/YmgE (transglycosylase-associated protein family)
MTLQGILIICVVGGIAGWLAGLIVKGFGFGILGNIILGIIGAFVGAWALGMLGIAIGGGLVGSIINAMIGAILVLVLIKLIKRA